MIYIKIYVIINNIIIININNLYTGGPFIYLFKKNHNFTIFY